MALSERPFCQMVINHNSSYNSLNVKCAKTSYILYSAKEMQEVKCGNADAREGKRFQPVRMRKCNFQIAGPV